MSEEALPRRFGRYVLFDHIGQGGMAEIYLARAEADLGGVRRTVIKEVLPRYAARKEFADMLVREARLAAKLSHANIVQVMDLGREDGDRLYIAMEYIEGFDLNTLLKRCSKGKVPLPPEFAVFIVTETLAGLDYAHRKDIVHRDVSPSNILVSFEGEVKLCDFGIAHANEHALAEGEQPSESIKGKAGYMSPEHARGDSIDARSDVFAAGIILWELFAGRRLYKPDAGALLDQARRAEIPDLPERDVPSFEDLRAITKKALAPSRDDRYASAAEMREALAEWASRTKLVANQVKLGQWLEEKLGADIVEQRSIRERAAGVLATTPLPAMAIRTPEPPPAVIEASPESLAAIDSSPPSAEGVSAEGARGTACPPDQTPEGSPKSSQSSEEAPSRGWLWLLVAIAAAAGVAYLYQR